MIHPYPTPPFAPGNIAAAHLAAGPLVDEVDADAGDQGGAVLEAHDGQVQTAGTRGEDGRPSVAAVWPGDGSLAQTPDTSTLKMAGRPLHRPNCGT